MNIDIEQSKNAGQGHEQGHPGKVHVFATYTSSARSEDFHAHLEDTVQEVISLSYKKLKEMPRTGDMVFGGDDPHRIDLAPYLGATLGELVQKGIALQPDHHHKEKGWYELNLELESEPGGA